MVWCYAFDQDRVLGLEMPLQISDFFLLGSMGKLIVEDTPDQANILLLIIILNPIFISVVLTIVVVYRGRGVLLRHRDVSLPLPT